MTVLEMYTEFRSDFPEISKKADKDFIDRFDELDPTLAYLWFESLANAFNMEMSNQVEPKKYQNCFDYFCRNYIDGSKTVKDCIDVALTENLFWRVSKEHAGPYWKMLPETIKELYVSFHGRIPA
ncbi:MAG: DUF7674 family protein [Cellvibrionaceae bacterium]